MSDAMRPSASLLCKLSSIAVHAEEFLSSNGHAVDRIALESALKDPEVKEWIDEMESLGLAPVKR